MRAWFMNHCFSTSVLIFLSLTSVDVLFVIFSRAFERSSRFTAPASFKESKMASTYFGLPHLIFEDVPQFVLALVRKKKLATHTQRELILFFWVAGYCARRGLKKRRKQGGGGKLGGKK